MPTKAKSVDIEHKIEIEQPKISKGYCIPLVDWEFIKSKISDLKDEPNVPYSYCKIGKTVVFSIYLKNLKVNEIDFENK